MSSPAQPHNGISEKAEFGPASSDPVPIAQTVPIGNAESDYNETVRMEAQKEGQQKQNAWQGQNPPQMMYTGHEYSSTTNSSCCRFWYVYIGTAIVVVAAIVIAVVASRNGSDDGRPGTTSSRTLVPTSAPTSAAIFFPTNVPGDENSTATLSLNLTGLPSNTVTVRILVKETVEGIFNADDPYGEFRLQGGGVRTWSVPKNKLRVVVEEREAMLTVDTDCSSGVCSPRVTERLDVDLRGLPESTNVYLQIFDPVQSRDETIRTISYQGGSLRDYTVLRLPYNVELNDDGATKNVNVDCSNYTDCSIESITASLKIDLVGLLPGYTSVGVFTADGTKIRTLRRQGDSIREYTVLQLEDYTVEITQWFLTKSIPGVDCSSGNCVLDDITSTLVVDGTSVAESADLTIENPPEKSFLSDRNIGGVVQNYTVLKVEEPYTTRVSEDEAEIAPEVNCSPGTCFVMSDSIGNELSADLTGLPENIITQLYLEDDLIRTMRNQGGGAYRYPVVRVDGYRLQVYDSGLTVNFENIDCLSGDCNAGPLYSSLVIVDLDQTVGSFSIDFESPPELEGTVGSLFRRISFSQDELLADSLEFGVICADNYSFRLGDGTGDRRVVGVDCPCGGNCTVSAAP